MDNCKYQLNIEGNLIKFDSELDLINYFKENNIGKDGIKYSLETSPKQIRVLNAIKDRFSENKYKNNKGVSVYEFLKNPHDIGNGPELLSPYFDTENYIKNEVNSRIKELVDSRQISPEETEVKSLEIREEIEKELVEDNFMKDIGANIHTVALKAIENGANSKEVNDAVFGFLTSLGNYKGVEYTPEEMSTNIKIIKDQLNKFVNFVYSLGTPLIKPRLMNYDNEIKDSPDLVVVDSNGNPHIVDITLSRKSFGDWASAKKLTQDYKLGVFRQMIQSITNTNNSGLYIAPFTMNNLDPTRFSLGTTEDRTATNPKLDFSSGFISSNLKKLMPSEFTELHQDSEVESKVTTVLKGILPNTYESKSKSIMSNRQDLINKVTNSFQEGKGYVLWDYLENKAIKIKNESDIPKIVDEYIARYNENKHSEVHKLTRTISQAILNKTGDALKFGSGSSEVIINSTFGKYTDGNWEIIENDLFANQGLIAFKNKVYGTIDVVNITTRGLNNIIDLGLGKTLLGKFKTNNEAMKDKEILPSTTTNVEMLRTLAVLNSLPELFDGYKLNDIKVLNFVFDAEWHSNNIDQIVYNFNEVFRLANKDGKLGVHNNFSNGKIKLSSPIEQLFREVWYQLSDSNYSELKDLAKGDRPDYSDNRLEWFKNVRNKLLSKYSFLGTAPEKNIDFTNPLQNLFRMVNDAVTYYSDIKFNFDAFEPYSRFGIKLSDAGHLMQTLLFGEGAEYDSKGRKVVGLFQGTMFATTDASPSKDQRKIFDVISEGHALLREEYMKIQSRVVKETNEYYKKCGRSGLEKMLLGNAKPYHTVFFRQVNGKISDEFAAKNPYDLSENLKDHERKYLKYILWEMYKFKERLPDEYLKMNEEQFSKSERFKEITSKEKYFQIPLMKAMDLTKWSTLTTGNFWKSMQNRINDIKDNIDPRNVTDIQRREADKQIASYNKMYNEFNIAENHREEMINTYKVDNFEVNLDTILNKFAFASLRENIMDDVLVIVNSAIMSLKFNAFESGRSKDIDDILEDMYKQIRISVYGIEPFKGEVADLLAVTKQIQKAASIAFISLRPVLMMKELIVGTFKNVSYSWSKVFGDDSFTIEELGQAYNKVLFNKMQSVQDFTIVDHLNRQYGIANMDINSIVKKSKTDRTGLFKFFSEHMYWMNTAPDYVNRLTLFVAKMIHDGCYDAHYVDSNGEFKYDPKKDKRFQNYFAKREQYKFKSAENDTKYNEERSLYLNMLDSFNSRYSRFGRKLLDEKRDLLPLAYTHEDRESIKTFADMSYGYYDHERSSLWKHTALGSIFGQFLTYWPSKVKYYFGKPMESKTGHREQMYETDENGNKKLLWLKEIYDENGNLTGTELTTENTGRQAIHYVNDPFEGLFYSLAKTMRDIATGNLENSSDLQKRRAMLAVHDLAMGLMLAAFVNILLQEFKSEKDKPYYVQALQGTTSAFYKATKEFDPFNSVFAAFSWTPSFVTLSSNMYKDINKLMTGGNPDLQKMFTHNLRMLEVLPGN